MIKRIFLNQYDAARIKKPDDQSGYITIRFIVNCKGITNRFRMYETDSLYQQFCFDPLITQQLQAITKNLHDWIPGKFDNRQYDSYYYLSFKINIGQLIDIMP